MRAKLLLNSFLSNWFLLIKIPIDWFHRQSVGSATVLVHCTVLISSLSAPHRYLFNISISFTSLTGPATMVCDQGPHTAGHNHKLIHCKSFSNQLEITFLSLSVKISALLAASGCFPNKKRKGVYLNCLLILLIVSIEISITTERLVSKRLAWVAIASYSLKLLELL